MASSGGNIKVVVRVRPFNSREKDRNAQCIVQMKESQTILIPANASDPKAKGGKGDHGQKTFAFDRSYWSFDRKDPHFAGQDNLHNDLGLPLLDNAFQGYNNCIFAYGQTGSGKSYSMMGYGEEYGVIPRICKDMFDRIADVQKDKNMSCTVEVSYLEIYNERVRDLLNPATKGNLKVREHPSTGPYVEDLAKLAVRSFQEIENLMDEGNKARTVAATNMNETSSRSHAVFTLTLSQKRHDVETSMDTEKVAKISLVDLAGSERATSTGATGARLKEGAEINRSLSTLGRVIAALADLSSGKKKNANMVPYRDSVLTWLLKDSLGGNSLTAMIAAISPADINYEETLSTLRYADSAKRIKNHAVVNEDPNARMIRELKDELAQLRAKLGGGGAIGGVAEEQYAPDTPLEKQIVSITQADGTIKKVSKAEIAEQLSQSEKLYKDLNQTWEEKLQKTEEIHKEREAALEELGISIEKGFVGLSTPKKMPHLVNLSDDPLLAECLVYNLKPGTTTVGNVDTATTAEIRLNGSKILQDHCTFENVDGAVTVVPKDNAAVMVNGVRVDKPKRLHSGYRVILGDFHIFRFNHPEEARAERAEQGSLLRHSMNANDLGSPSPSGRPGHERSLSTLSFVENGYDFDSDGRASPAQFNRSGRDSDWSFARREAVSALLGPDQKMSALTDDELDVLFEDLQRVRAGRKGKVDNRQFEGDDDQDSVTSYPVREKYASNGTLDNFSLDTALTVPTTPQTGEEDQRLRIVREDMQSQLEQQKEDYQAKLKFAEEANIEVEQIKAEKVKMEERLLAAKEEMQQQLLQQKEEFARQQKELQDQKEEFEQKLAKLQQPASISMPRTNGSSSLLPHQIEQAKRVLAKWQEKRYVAMAELVLQNASVLKEAQVMSHDMDKHVVFQFCVVDIGHTSVSSYDLVLNDVSGEDDEELDVASKPCIGVRVIDFKNHIIHLWSLSKLRKRIRLMRQMHQYLNSPNYSQHFRLDNPFTETCQLMYSRIGDSDIALTAVFEARVQDFTVDVISPYTFNVIGIMRLSLEPSSAEAPSSTLKFNVVMHDLVGFPEREGTEVHAQLFVPGISDENGVTTTQLIKDFDEGPIRFESVHSMSLPMSSPRNASLRVAVFARITSTHLDKLLSWDDMRDSTPSTKEKRIDSRLPESEFYTEDRHDIFTRIQMQEISEDGTYQPVEVVQTSALDAGAFQLHQGLQRRVVVNLTHSSGEALQWKRVASLRIGNVRLLDHTGKASDLETTQAEVPLKLVAAPVVKDNADGTSNVTIVGQWDSSHHGSLLLDRTTADKYRIQISLLWNVTCEKLSEPMIFTLDMCLQMRSRSYIRPSSFFSQFLNTGRIIHSTVGMFSVGIRPTAVKRAYDLWRMNTINDFVKGEENLSGWTPRGVSLIQDFMGILKRRRRMAEMETARGVWSSRYLSVTNGRSNPDEPLNEQQEQLLRKVLDLWQNRKDAEDTLLVEKNISPPKDGAAFAAANGSAQPKPSLVAEVRYIPKNPTLIKGSYVMMPDDTNTRWVRRYLELRKPYLHIYSVPEGDELNVVNLSNARVDHEPQLAKLLKRPSASVFAVFAPKNAYLFATRSEREKVEWILRIDQSYFSSGSGTPDIVDE
ncbi:kinesin heavy chain [Aulographum hederae CBS 113979]|uniref:Kinesin heavy chain n=1 Tax=Aulographum hederae CBS 113979 TaxID=1176131 RepID=A0A6G1H9F4_9PEZI|nr:kinesin heavy chain [Aulographum hederae CBS 113979]